MTTPQRALELAEKLEKCRYMDSYNRADTIEAIAILRHYVEIMQAEAVGTTIEVPRHENASFGVFDKGMAPAGTKLIIKPKPLP